MAPNAAPATSTIAGDRDSTPSFVLTGQLPDDAHANCKKAREVFKLRKEQHNGRPTYTRCKETSADGVVFMSWQNGHWLVNDAVGTYSGRLVCCSDAMKPEDTQSKWMYFT